MRKHEKILIHVLLLLGILSSYCPRILLSRSQFSLVPGSMYRVGVGVCVVPCLHAEMSTAINPNPSWMGEGLIKLSP